MADAKFNDLPAVTTLADGDLLAISLAGAAGSYKITKANLQVALGNYWTTVIKGSDETISATTAMQNDNDLLFAVTAGMAYEFEFHIYYDSPAAADFKHDCVLSAGATTRAFRQHVGFGPTTVAIQAGQVADLTTVISCGANAGEALLSRVVGFVIPGSNATFNLRWAQVASDAGNTVVKAGSSVRYRARA